MELLLEVVAQRHVHEGPTVGGELHARREAALHHGDVAGGEVPVQIGQMAPVLDALAPRQRPRIDARPRHDDEPQPVDQPLGVRDRLDGPTQQPLPDP